MLKLNNEHNPYPSGIPHRCSSRRDRGRVVGVVMPPPSRKRERIDGVMHQECCSCLKMIPESEFYKRKRAKNGLRSRCKRCHCRQSVRTRNPELARITSNRSRRRRRREDPELFRARERARKRKKNSKTRAREVLNRAVRSGLIARPKNCSECGAEHDRINGHHTDYDKPLDVEWLCPPCHGRRHRADSGAVNSGWFSPIEQGRPSADSQLPLVWPIERSEG